jgi:CubicO group peptidase (beta-lactamase class C family)
MTSTRRCPGALLAALALIGPAWAGDVVFPGDRWQKADPASQGVDAAKLEAAVEFLKAHSGRDGVGQLVIVRNGYLIWQGEEADKVHGVWSCTKSFTSTCLGLLVDDGKCTLDTRAKELLPGMAETYPAVTLRHFTTMTSGYRAVGDEPRGGYLHGPSRTPFVPGPEPLFAPGSHYAYWDSAMNQFAHVLTRIAGEPLDELFQRRIADPIGMDPDEWRWGDFGEINGLRVNGGSGNNNNHVFISARQMARLGWLFLHRGRWRGRQLISSEWVDQATSVQVPAATPLGHPESGIDGPGVYGFNWWRNGRHPHGKRKWPGAPESTFAASGHNNNDMFVIPEWSMVIVRLGLDQSDHEITDEEYGQFLGNVGRSIIGVGR